MLILSVEGTLLPVCELAPLMELSASGGKRPHNVPYGFGHRFSPKLCRQKTSGNIFQTGPCFAQMYLPNDLISQQEDSFVVGTAEGTVFHFQLVSVTSNSSEKQWVRTKPFQHHTHDVRAVAHSPTALISGGGLHSLPGCRFTRLWLFSRGAFSNSAAFPLPSHCRH